MQEAFHFVKHRNVHLVGVNFICECLPFVHGFTTLDQALHYLYPSVSVGGHVIVDDFTDWVGCRRAVADFRLVRGIDAQREPIQVIIREPMEGLWFHKPSIDLNWDVFVSLTLMERFNPATHSLALAHLLMVVRALCSRFPPSQTST